MERKGRLWWSLFGPKKNFVEFCDHVFFLTVLFKKFSCFRKHTGQELMCILSIRISSLRTCSACALHQFSHFSNVHFVYRQHTRIRNWCTHWACASGTDACTEHIHQQLMHALSIRVMNWCVSWTYATGTDAYASISDAYAQHKRKNSKLEKIPSKHAGRTRKELMRALSVRVRNWYVHRAYVSGTDACAEHTHQKLNDA